MSIPEGHKAAFMEAAKAVADFYSEYSRFSTVNPNQTSNAYGRLYIQLDAFWGEYQEEKKYIMYPLEDIKRDITQELQQNKNLNADQKSQYESMQNKIDTLITIIDGADGITREDLLGAFGRFVGRLPW
jgi:hypothetical protein